MSVHDEFFKDLLEHFCADLVHLVVPKVAAELELEDPAPVKRELFTDYPHPVPRQVDLAWKVLTRTGEPELVVVHVEVERRRQRLMERRMLEYAVLLRAREAAPVLAIVVFLQGGAAGTEKLTAAERIAGETVLRVDYFAFGLSRCRAEDYLASPRALAWGLAALMSTTMEPAEHRLRCMQAIAAADLGEYQRYLLVNCVGTYLELTGDDRRRYEEMIAQEKARKVAELEMTWFDKIERQGEKRGEERGQLRGERRMLRRMLEARFGPLNEENRRTIEALDSTERIERIFDRALEAASLSEIDLAD